MTEPDLAINPWNVKPTVIAEDAPSRALAAPMPSSGWRPSTDREQPERTAEFRADEPDGGWRPTSPEDASILPAGFSTTSEPPITAGQATSGASTSDAVVTMEEWFTGADDAEPPRDDWVASESAKPSLEETDADPSFELPGTLEPRDATSRDETGVRSVAYDAAPPTGSAPPPAPSASAPPPAPATLPHPAEYSTPLPFAPYAPGAEHVEACQVVEPMFEQIVIAEPDRCWCGPCSPWKKLFKFRPCDGSTDLGIGRKRLPYAPFEIESAQPGNNFTLRYDMAYGMDKPDRSEYFWAEQGDSPPLNEREVDYQQFRIIREAGSERFSLTTEYPFRFLDPDVNDNTAGLGDINIAPKIVLVDGKDWQLSHVFRTYVPTGSKRKGLGTGHLSLEPGALLRYAWTEDTNLFGQLKFWFPIGGNRNHSGPVCVYGFGWATNLCDSDTYAMIGTIEMTGVSYLDGLATNSVGQLVSNDSSTSFNFQPGMRFVLGPAGDLGLFEFGVSTGHAFSINGQYEHQFRLDLRWSY